MASWYEEVEPLFLVDYVQFGSALRAWSAEAALARLKLTIDSGDVIDAEDERRIAAAVLVQQLGHAFEDLAAVLGGLAVRTNGDPGMMKVCLGRRASAGDLAEAPKSLCFTMFNYRGTLMLPDVVGDPPPDDFARAVGLEQLASVVIPGVQTPGATSWLLEGLVRQLHHSSTTNAPGIRRPFTKLKHGAIAVSDVDAFKDGPQAQESRVGVLVPPGNSSAGSAAGLPTDDDFLGAVVGEIDRVRAAIRVIVPLYLLAHHSPALHRVGVPVPGMFDERVWTALTGSSLVGDALDFASVIPYRRPLFG